MSITLPAITRGATSQLIPVRFQDLSLLNGAGKTGLTTSSFTSVYYYRGLAASPVQITLDGTMTPGTWKTGGFAEVSSANQPGEYQLGLPDLAVGTANASPYLTVVFVPTTPSGANQVELVIPLTAFDLQTATEPVNVTQWNGTNVASPATAGVPDVNVKNMNNVAATSITTVNANQGTTQPINFTGTGGSALAKVDVTDIATAAVSTGSAQLGVNVVNIGGGASQGAAGYVGTDQSKITNPTATVDLSGTTVKNVDNAIANVTTVATTTNLTNAPTAGDFTATMKTSLNASTPASVTTVTGNVNGNIAGNVVGTIGSLAAQAKTDVAAAVLNAVAASYNVAGSIGALINLITSGSTSAAAVWNYLVSSAGTDITKMGGYISVFLAAIRAKTDTIGAASVVVVSPVTAAGNLSLVQGDDYLAADGRALDFTFTGLPSLIGSAALLRFAPLGSNSTYNIGTDLSPIYFLTGTILSATEVQFEMTSAQSARLPTSPPYTFNARFEVQITLSDGSVVTPTPLNLGKASIAPQAAP